MYKVPFTSIIIINYNGKHHLQDCLLSVFNINYPKKKYEVILVDNDSQDDSVAFIKKEYPQVKLIESKQNLGFAGGNNLGFSKARGEYIVLLNNDTIVDKNWLKELAKTADSKNVGIVSSKLYFDIPFLELEIISSTEVKSNIYNNCQEYVPYGLIVDSINCNTPKKNFYVWYKRGFYEKKKSNYTSTWTDGHAIALVPFIDPKEEVYQISLHGQPHDFNSKVKYKITVAGKVIIEDSIPAKEVKQVNIRIKRTDIEDKLIYLIQNAGNIIFKNGLGRDRGSVIKRSIDETKEFYDYDSRYYSEPKELVAMCGASCLIKRKVLTDKQLFDPAYFMYYEDVDLSLKIWRKGYDIVFEPKSIVYHKHRSTTNEQTSEFFMSHIDKNHLFFLLTHFPMKVFLIQFAIFLAKYVLAYTVVFLSKRFHYYEGMYKRYSIKLEAKSIAFTLFKENFFRMYRLRNKLISEQKRDFNQLYKELY